MRGEFWKKASLLDNQTGTYRSIRFVLITISVKLAHKNVCFVIMQFYLSSHFVDIYNMCSRGVAAEMLSSFTEDDRSAQTSCSVE